MKNELDSLHALRQKLFAAISRRCEEGCPCKRYEGEIEITQSYPGFFDDPEARQTPEQYTLRLHLYVLGPNRHYEFSAPTLQQAIHMAQRQIDIWLGEDSQ